MRIEPVLFRAAVAAAGLVPVVAGVAGVIQSAMLADRDGFLAGHGAYLSGLLLGIGLAFWATLNRPQDHTARYRLLTAIVFLGGLARLYSLAVVGDVSTPTVFALAMELVVTPAICLWQARIARLEN